MTKPELLILDDDIDVLNALARVLRHHFTLHLFSNPLEALTLLRHNFIPLILSDMRMPIMDGAEFLAQAAEITPGAKRFILTGHSDINRMLDAVNEGKITHYFTKPWDNDELIDVLQQSFTVLIEELRTKSLLKQHQQQNSQLSLLNMSMELTLSKNKKKLSMLSGKEAKSFSRLRKTFQVFIDIYANAIALHTQEHTGHSHRVASHARLLAHQLGCDKLIIFQIYVAGLLYEAGKLTLPQSLLTTPYDQLTQLELAQFEQFLQHSKTQLAPLEEMMYVANIIEHISEQVNGLGRPEHLSGDNIPLGSRILAIVTEFDNLIIGRSTKKPLTVQAAITRLQLLANEHFDLAILKQYITLLEQRPQADEGDIEYPIDITKLVPKMILTQDIHHNGGRIPVLTKGMVIEQHHIERLLNMSDDISMIFIG